MSLQDNVYDLGEVDTKLAPARPGPVSAYRPRAVGGGAPHVASAAPRTAVGRIAVSTPRHLRFNLPGTVSLFVPGGGQFVLREPALGLFLLTSVGFLASFAWALLTTMDRLAPTLVLLGHSRAAGIWLIGAAYTLAALLHIAGVLTAWDRDEAETGAYGTHSGLAAFASALVPGWGQILNGHRARAGLFLCGVWILAAGWLLASPQIQAWLVSLNLYLPTPLEVLASPAVRWSAPAVLWALSVYDAIIGARARIA